MSRGLCSRLPLAIATVAGLVLSDCSGVPPQHPRMACAEDPELLEALETATERWEEATGLGWTMGPCQTGWTHVRWIVDGTADCSGSIAGWDGCTRTTRFGHVIEISDRLQGRPVRLELVMIHELGHVLSPFSGHPSGQTGIMSNPIWGDKITLSDIDWVCDGADDPCSKRDPEE